MSANYDSHRRDLMVHDTSGKTLEETGFQDLTDIMIPVKQSNQNKCVQYGYRSQANTSADFQQNYIITEQQYGTQTAPITFQNINWQQGVLVNNNYFTPTSNQNGAGNMFQPQFQHMISGHQVPQMHQNFPMMMNQNQMHQQHHQQLTQSKASATDQFMMSPYAVPEYQAIPVKKDHEAHISLVPGSSGGYQAIVKRKRKRTMFTTEQVNYLEAVFSKTPYVSRERRQCIVKELQVTDSAVKIWFQNRRIRGKKELEESQDNCHEPNCCFRLECEPVLIKRPPTSTKDFYNNYMSSIMDTPSNSSGSEPSSSPLNLQVDELEAKLLNKVGNLGYISLTDKDIEDIVNLIDKVLPDDIEISHNSDIQTVNQTYIENHVDESIIKESAHIDTIDLTVIEPKDVLQATVEKVDFSPDIKMDDSIEVQSEVIIGTTEDSDGSTVYSGSIYEPISPALPEELRVDDLNPWNPSKETREKLFNIFFC